MGANEQVGMGRDPIHQGEYSSGDLQAVLGLGTAGPHCRELQQCLIRNSEQQKQKIVRLGVLSS